MKKYILYTIGIVIMALGVAISSFHGLGASPFDSLNFNVASITNLEIATTMLIFNAIFVLLFFIIHRNKDNYLSVICLFAFHFSLFNLKLLIISSSSFSRRFFGMYAPGNAGGLLLLVKRLCESRAKNVKKYPKVH